MKQIPKHNTVVPGGDMNAQIVKKTFFYDLPLAHKQKCEINYQHFDGK